MKLLCHPLVLITLALASCWWVYGFGKRSVGREVAEPLPFEKQLRTASFREARSDRNRSERLLLELDDCVSVEDFSVALDLLQFEADKTEENRLLSGFFKRWLEVYPLDALAEVRRVESLRHDIIRTSAVFETWARERPNDALQLLVRVLDGRQSDPSSKPPFLDGVDPPEYLLSLISGLAKENPQATANLLRDASSSPVMSNSLDVLFQNWFPENTGEVFQWFQSLEKNSFREEVISKIGTKAGQLDDPREGIAWAQSLATPIEQKQALGSLTRQWAQRRSRDAFQWVSQQPDELKFDLIPPVISELTKVDPGAAADWLDQFEASPRIDPSVAAYALSISTVNPAAALGTAEVITDQVERKRVMDRITRDWERRDPESFRSFQEKAE